MEDFESEAVSTKRSRMTATSHKGDSQVEDFVDGDCNNSKTKFAVRKTLLVDSDCQESEEHSEDNEGVITSSKIVSKALKALVGFKDAESLEMDSGTVRLRAGHQTAPATPTTNCRDVTTNNVVYSHKMFLLRG